MFGWVLLIRIISHRLVLDPNARLSASTAFKRALTDSVIEVRNFSHLCLAGLLRMESSEEILGVIANAPKSRRRQPKSEAQSEEKIEARHGRVLALSAAILSHPTDLPDWMADAIAALCSLSDEDPAIKQTIIRTIGEFKKVSCCTCFYFKRSIT